MSEREKKPAEGQNETSRRLMETTARDLDPALAALIGRMLLGRGLSWRHHGIGLLQAYVVEGPVEFRIHVWHPELRFVDDDSGMIHDHRFRLESQVLLGAIHDTEVLLHRHDKGWVVPRPIYQMWEVQNARQAAASGDGWVKKLDWGAGQTITPDEAPFVGGLVNGSPLYTIDTVPSIYRSGSRYSYPARKFHRTETKELTVTLCKKSQQENVPARILAREGAVPKHGIGEPMRDWAGAGAIADPREKFLWEAGTRLLEMARSA